jgi:hypothetical protein
MLKPALSLSTQEPGQKRWSERPKIDNLYFWTSQV